MRATDALVLPVTTSWRRYYDLTKPRIVLLMLFTALVGMALTADGPVPWLQAGAGLLGIGLAAAAGAVFNHIIDRRLDAVMTRTRNRPLPSGQVDLGSALVFGALLAAAGMFVLMVGTNTLTAALTFTALIGYSVIYTAYLKRTTPQNVVWGGAAGAAPPLLGAAAVTGEVGIEALLLFFIIFIWTPPHFWPLAIRRKEEYRRASIPMLPLTHGLAFTKAQVLGYSGMLLTVSLLPFVLHSSGWLYLAGAIPLGLGFVYHAWRLYRGREDEHAMATFRYSILYLFALFALLLADRFVPGIGS